MATPIDWAAVEQTIATVVRIATGLSEARVFWQDQELPEPIGVDGSQVDYVTLRRGDVVPVGIPYAEDFTDLTRPPDPDTGIGTEIEERISTLVRFTVSVQAFTGSVIGNDSAVARLSRLGKTLALSSHIAALNAAHLACFDVSKVTNIGKLGRTDFEGRAEATLEFYASDEAASFTTYIEKMTVSESINGDAPETKTYQ